MYKIVWAEYFNLLPTSGVIEKADKKYYFATRKTPTFICSVVGIAAPEPEQETCFNVYEIDDSTLEQLTREHDTYCDSSGEPKRHGDPRRIPKETTSGLLAVRSQITYHKLIDQITAADIENYEVENYFVCE